MRFFKPTPTKIILAIVIIIVWYIWISTSVSHYACSAILSRPLHQPPISIQIIHSIIRAGMALLGGNYALILPQLGCAYNENQIAGNIAPVFLVVLSYLFSCTIVFFVQKLMKKKKNRKR